MSVGSGDPRRARAAASEHDRARLIALVRRYGTDGLLSTREVEDAIEQTFRARTLGELDGVAAALPRSPHIAADIVLSHGLTAAQVLPRSGPWWRGMLAWSLGLDVLWVLIWLVTGGAVGWLVLGIVLTMSAFTVRFMTGYRRHVTGKPPRRRRML